MTMFLEEIELAVFVDGQPGNILVLVSLDKVVPVLQEELLLKVNCLRWTMQ